MEYIEFILLQYREHLRLVKYMSDKNGKVTWVQLIVILCIASTVLGTVWIKLEKIDDAVGVIKTDIAVIRAEISKGITLTKQR